MTDSQFIISCLLDGLLAIILIVLVICVLKFKNESEKVKYFALRKGLTEEDLEPHTKALTKRQKRIVKAFYVECKSIVEIADELNLSIETINKEKKEAVDRIMKKCI